MKELTKSRKMMKRIKVTLTEKQIDTILEMIQQEFHFENDSIHRNHLKGLRKNLIKQLTKQI